MTTEEQSSALPARSSAAMGTETPDSEAPKSYTANDLHSAYIEGFIDGQDHGNLDWKYLPVNLAWFESVTREHLLGLQMTDEQRSQIKAWYNAPISKKPGDAETEAV